MAKAMENTTNIITVEWLVSLHQPICINQQC